MKIFEIPLEKGIFEIFLSNDGYVHGKITYRFRGKTIKTPISAVIDNTYGVSLPKSVAQELQKSIFIRELFPELTNGFNGAKAL